MSEFNCDTILHGGYIVTANKNNEVIKNGCIAVKNGAIVFAGTSKNAADIWRGEKNISLENAILMPGLFNSHTHIPMTILRGIADDLPLLDWLRNHIFPIEAKLTRELIALGSLIGCAEMIAGGTVGFFDGYMHEDVVGKVAEKCGIKCVLGEGFFEFPSPFFKTPIEAWDTISAQHDLFKNSELVKTSVAPHSAYTTSPDQLRESLNLALELNIPWQMHCAESESETDLTIQKYGMRPIEFLKNNDLLTPLTRLHHCVDVTDDEIKILSASGTRISHNPQSNLKLGSGICPLKKHIENGVGVGFGTDGAASNNDLDMFEEMRTAALLQKGFFQDPTVLPADSVINIATTGGAENLGFKDSGKIQEGFKADIIAVRTDHPHMTPLYNPVSHIVYSAKASDVILNMCNGKILYENGHYLTVDIENLKIEAQKAVKWVEKHLP